MTLIDDRPLAGEMVPIAAASAGLARADELAELGDRYGTSWPPRRHPPRCAPTARTGRRSKAGATGTACRRCRPVPAISCVMLVPESPPILGYWRCATATP